MRGDLCGRPMAEAEGGGVSSQRTGGVSRVRFIEMRATTAWMVDGELWRFRDGTEIAVGDVNDLEATEPMVTGAVALGLINAGKAEAMAVTELDNADEDFAEDFG